MTSHIRGWSFASWASVGLVIAASCATSQSAQKTAPAAPPEAKQQLSVAGVEENLRLFDIASCVPRQIDTKMNADVLGATLYAQSPAFQECFIDPKNARELGSVAVTAKVGAQVEYDVKSDVLTEDGKACILSVVQRLNLPPNPAAKEPISATATIQASQGPLKFGKTKLADALGNLRLELPKACSCFQEFQGKGVPPKTLVNVQLGAAAKPGEVLENTPLAACIAEKSKGAKLPTEEGKFRYPVLLINAYGPSTFEGLGATEQMHQLDAVRQQRTADVFAARGHRNALALEYVALAKRYNEKADSKLYVELRERCQGLVAADAEWVNRVENLRQVGNESLSFVRAQSKTSTGDWSQAEARLKGLVESYDADVKVVEELRVGDDKRCPKPLKKK